MMRISFLAMAVLTAGCNANKTDDNNSSAGPKGALSGGQSDPFSRGLNAAQRLTAKLNLKQIGVAMHNHHDSHNKLPSAGNSGKGLSWRVHLLPHLEQQSLYHAFRMNEPWDSDHNRKLISKMPRIFNTPGTPNDGKTAMHVFVGRGTPFGGSKPLKWRDITDGTANTILAVFSGPEMEWTKPGGLEFDASNPTAALGGMPAQGLLVLFLDGSTRTLPASIDPKTLSLLIQHADGQQLPPSF